jgi:hypothetical protein
MQQHVNMILSNLRLVTDFDLNQLQAAIEREQAHRVCKREAEAIQITLTDQETAFIARGLMVHAIKAIRDREKTTLLTAKLAADMFRDELRRRFG